MMNYQESIDVLKRNKPTSDLRKCGKELCEACDVAISAMHELEKYHNTGLTPKQVEEMICELSATKRVLGHYQPLGTLEEVREAAEKQMAKGPIYEGDGYAPDGTFVWDEWICPRCGTRYEVEYEEHDYCPNCGQHIDWSEEDD